MRLSLLIVVALLVLLGTNSVLAQPDPWGAEGQVIDFNFASDDGEFICFDLTARLVGMEGRAIRIYVGPYSPTTGWFVTNRFGIDGQYSTNGYLHDTVLYENVRENMVVSNRFCLPYGEFPLPGFGYEWTPVVVFAYEPYLAINWYGWPELLPLVYAYTEDGRVVGQRTITRDGEIEVVPEEERHTLTRDGVIEVSPETETGNTAACNTIADHDCDALPNGVEQLLVETYKPLLYFDEGEPEPVSDATATVYQVTPIWQDDGDPEYDGAVITYVILYRNDNGIQDIDIDTVDRLTCDALTAGACELADLVTASSDLGLGAHLGDSEAVKLYVNMDGGWSNTWYLEGAWIKQHYDPWEWYPIDQLERQIPGSNESLPNSFVLFVSAGKHGMYPSHNSCERAGFRPSIKGIEIPIDIRFENCSNGELVELTVPFRHNVGERGNQTEVFDNSDVLQWLFPGESAWEEQLFCGGQGADTRDQVVVTGTGELCAGSLNGKWEPGQVFAE